MAQRVRTYFAKCDAPLVVSGKIQTLGKGGGGGGGGGELEGKGGLSRGLK